MKNKFVIIETTLPNSATAKKLAKILLQENLATCIQLTPTSSSYIWQKKIKNSSEILLSIKSKKSLYKQIEKAILKQHPYELPQILAIEINQGFKPYLEWIESNLKNA